MGGKNRRQNKEEKKQMADGNIQKQEYDGITVNIRIKLTGLWIIYILLSLISSVFMFYQTGYITNVASGVVGSTAINQSVIMISDILAVLTLVPVFVNLFVDSIKTTKLINIVVGILCIVLKDVSGITDDSWMFNKVNGVIGIIIILFIIVTSIRWNREHEKS
jgi:hypothetical protein